ncbi:MAG: DUF4466 family protein [Tannerella sp.]|jgi:hypothetical protein|nr:DUF4466 family protein [Tannerella sp.]
MKYSKLIYLVSVLTLAFVTSCSDNEIPSQESVSDLSNDGYKRSLGPNVAGLDMEFVYAMAIPQSVGKIVSAKVEASIAGADGTYLEHRSYYTDQSGADQPVTVGNPCVTSGAKSEVTFSVDTCAATLRYYYRIPEDAKGKQVNFTFSAKASNGKEVTYKLGPYDICKMDMKLDVVLTDGEKCYFSLADMAAYDASEASSKGGSIDLVYLYRKIANITFEHAFVAPACDSEYKPGVSLPSGVSNNTPIRKVYGLRDRHLANLQYGIYVDDPDFLDLDFSNMPNYAINVKNEGGLWIESQDGKYRAYIYVNEVNPGSSSPKIPTNSARISIKRYTMK